MANHAYIALWCREHSEQAMLGLFEKLLTTVPLSAQQPGFSWLVIRAVDPTESPLVEHDLRGQGVAVADIVAMLLESLHADCAFEVQAHWDLWAFDEDRWKKLPQRLEVVCFGEEYDDGAFDQSGHFQIDVGFEHLFTGHAGLLGANGAAAAEKARAPEHPAEAEFIKQMESPERLREYREKTRENIRALLAWVQQVQGVLPVERFQLWSEGEENFEARLDEIVAAH